MTKRSKNSETELTEAEQQALVMENGLRAATTLIDWMDIRQRVRDSGSTKYAPTDDDRARVLWSSVLGMPQERIAEMFGMHVDTLRNHFLTELEFGLAATMVDVGKRAMAKALGGDSDMIKFVLSRRGGVEWKDNKAAAVEVNVQPQIESRSAPDPDRVNRALDQVVERVLQRIDKKVSE